jgi:5-methyltetrahydrofolate--homocysteine methyltransferase
MGDIMNDQKLIEKIAYNVIQGNLKFEYPGNNLKLKGKPGVSELIQKALNQNINPEKIIRESLAKPMDQVMEKYEIDDYLAPHVLASAKSVGVAMDMLAPQLKEAGIKRDKFAIAGVKGDFHDLGLNCVALMIRGIGFETMNLGANVSANQIVETVKHHHAAYVGLSAFDASSLGEMEHVITRLLAEGIRDKLKVIIGGAATSDQFAERIGADAYCGNAFEIRDTLMQLDNWSGFAGADLN